MNPIETFQQFDLTAPIQRALTESGYRQPTPIQAKTIPLAIDGRDVLGCARTGTGKTAAFGLPLLHKLNQQKRKALVGQPQALVLVPARELALQIVSNFSVYGKYLPLRTALVYGGVNQGKQVQQMERGVHILVATPGRLLDLVKQRVIALNRVSMFVLDEADRMMDMGFLPDLKRIMAHLPSQRQSLFFSATLPPKIKQLSRELLCKPVEVNITSNNRNFEQIAQEVVFIGRNSKQAALNAIASRTNVNRLLVFTRTKRSADKVMQRLVKAGIKAAAIHGDKSQAARVKALESFRRNHVQVLVATDVASRGIDVDGVTHVVNYDMPEDPESYVHRIGRTGRAGCKGNAISLCSRDETKYLRTIEKLIGHKVPVAQVATDKERDQKDSKIEDAPSWYRFQEEMRLASSVPSERDGSASKDSRSFRKAGRRQRKFKRGANIGQKVAGRRSSH